MPEIGDYMTIEEAAQAIGITRAAVYRIIERGDLTSERHWGRQFLRRAAVAAYRPKQGGWPKGKSRKQLAEQEPKR